MCWGAREAVAKATRTGMFVFALSGVWVVDFHGDRVEVNLPEAATRNVVVKEGPVISITNNRQVFFQEQAVDIADLKLMLAPYEEDKDTVPVYLRCDEEVPYGFVLKVMAAVEYEGFLNLSLVTDQPAPDVPERSAQ